MMQHFLKIVIADCKDKKTGKKDTKRDKNSQEKGKKTLEIPLLSL